MGRAYPALDVRVAGTQLGAELLYAALDDFAPFAIEERESGARVFFTTSSQRDRAVAALSSRYEMSPVDVADDDWARRSQQNLQPITAGRVTIFPNLESRIISLESPTESRSPNPVSESRSPNPASPIHVVIPPSMGFGTGHHATTRLCLEALQTLDVTGKTVLDVGTGSGVLAIVAARLGARSATGIDIDPDAVQAARDNLGLNPLPRFGPRPADPAQDVEAVRFIVADLEKEPLPVADAGVDAGSAGWDVVVANLTGALLVRSAPTLIAATRPGGVVIASGLLREERDEVLRALTTPRGSLPSYVLEWERHEDDWVGLAVGTR